MSNWLLSLLKPLFSWLLSFGVKRFLGAIERYFNEKAKVEERDALRKKYEEELLQSSQDPNLTAEERAKRQEDAWQKYVSDSDKLNNNP
jgi:hypothetical protein